MNAPLVKKLNLVFHTIRYLRPQQIIYRLYYKIRKPIKLKQPLTEQRPWTTPWSSPTYCNYPICTDNKISFLNEMGEMSDWENKQKSKLWLYNLHYFHCLNTAESAEHAVFLNSYLQQWINENKPLAGTGWEPYPLSLRIVNWVIWFAEHPKYATQSGLDSLSLQTEALLQQIEYHILANHLFCNAKALIFAGTYFTGKRATFWLKKGLTIIDKQINEQFLADGGHFELTPMYHSLLLWDICDLINLCDKSSQPQLLKRRAQWVNIVQKGMQWLTHMIHPDGDISFFNDSTLGIAPTYLKLKEYVDYLSIEIKSNFPKSIELLPNSGYCALYFSQDHKAILDVGQTGPNYQPGHAHADTLSFEISLFNQRVFVNSGISHYQGATIRQRQRGTKKHNTLMLNHVDSSEVWSEFRVARRALAYDLSIEANKIQCTHNGYQRLPGKNTHTRTWEMESKQLNITDKISGSFSTAISHLYLHPTIKIEHYDPHTLRLILPEQQKVTVSVSNNASLTIEDSTWHPGFGLAVPNLCVVIKLTENHSSTVIDWSSN